MEVVVVGGGASGVCSALMLARYGHAVTLLEHGPRIAPLLRGFSRGGLHFDTGFHQAGALDKKGILRRYLNFVGVLEHLTLEPFRDDCCSLCRFASGEPRDVCFPQGVRRAGRSLAGLWPEHAGTIKKFFSDVEEAYFHSPFIDPRRMTPESLRMMGGGSLESYLRDLESPKGLPRKLPVKLKSLMTSRAVYYGTPPERAVFEELALVTYSMLEGVHAIRGGGAALAGAFEAALSRAGVKVRTGVTVTGVLGGSGADRGAVRAVVMESGEELPCEACIYTGHPRELPGMLPEGALRPSMVRHLRNLEETHSYFMLFGSSKSDFLSGRDMLLCLSDDIDEAYRDFSFEASWLHLYSGTPSADGRYPVGVGAGVNPWPAPPGHAGGHARHGFGRRPEGYAEWKAGVAAKALEKIRRHVPELDDFELVECSSEFSMRDWVWGSSGSLYGKLHSADAFPVMPFTRLNGFLLAGQCVILPGLLGTFISAAVACGSLVGFETLFRDLACINAE